MFYVVDAIKFLDENFMISNILLHRFKVNQLLRQILIQMLTYEKQGFLMFRKIGKTLKNINRCFIFY